MTTFKDLVWFARKSWGFLGCDRGTGRWDARRHYVTRLLPATKSFLKATRRDRAEATGAVR